MKDGMRYVILDQSQYYPTSVRMNPDTRSLVKVNEHGEYWIWDTPFSDCSFRIIYDPRVPVGGIIFCNSKGVPIPAEKLMEYGIPQGESRTEK